MLMPSTPPYRARSTLRTSASTPSLLKPRRLMTASCSGSRNMRGFGLPGCGRGVVVPTSRKPKPSAPSASTYAPFLSSPAARPTGFANCSPNASTASGSGFCASSGLSPLRYAASIAFRPRPCAVSASKAKRKGLARPYTGSSEVELDALRQRQVVRIVDRVGLAAHVRLPRVGARLAAAAGFLLAAERAADLGAAGADVDVRDAAVGAPGGQVLLRGLEVLREDRGRQALRHAVLHRDRVVDVLARHHVEDRRK